MAVDKSSDAFRTISEVADDLDLPQHVLRFWETRFSQIKPMKRGGGRRYYRPDDVDLLKGIRRLLYGEGYTIKGVQRILKEQGVRAVVALGQGTGALDSATRARLGAGGEGDFGPSEDGFGDVEFVSADEEDVRPEPSFESGSHQSGDAFSAEHMAQRFAPGGRAPASAAPRDRQPVLRRDPEFEEPTQPTRSPFAPVLDRFRGVASRLTSEPATSSVAPTIAEAGGPKSLSRDELRRLQATLFELLECKRLLDQTR